MVVVIVVVVAAAGRESHDFFPWLIRVRESGGGFWGTRGFKGQTVDL